MHGLNSGNYTFEPSGKKAEKVYLDVSSEKLDLYRRKNNVMEKYPFISFFSGAGDSTMQQSLVLRKQSLDIDVTAIVLKYRPSVNGLQAQMITDFNMALYAGWRNDRFSVKCLKDPLGKYYQKVINRGFDFGVLAGPGSTLISPFTTNGKRTDEYSGMILQTGVAGFIESNIASFGLALGIDYLLNKDRAVWIYTNKPWVGFTVGVALN